MMNGKGVRWLKRIGKLWLVVALLCGAAVLGTVRDAVGGETETAAVAYCAAAVSTGPAFAYCVGSVLTKQEIQKCLSGQSCFGKNNEVRKIIDGIRSYGLCGGPGSELRKILGSRVCGSTACKKGPRGKVTLVNNTGATLHFMLESTCGSRTRLSVPAGYEQEFVGGKGDQWFNIAVRSDGGTVEYGLDSGSTHEFEWDGNLLDVVNVTPRWDD